MNIISRSVDVPKYSFGLIVICFAAWFGWEFSHTIKLTDIPWDRGGAIEMGIFSCAVTFLFLVFRKLLVQHAIGALAVVCVAFSVGAVGVAPLITVCAFLFSSILVGEALIVGLGVQNSDFLHRLLQLVLGLGVYATLVALMVCAPISYASVYFVLLVAPVIIWRMQAKKLFADIFVAQSQLNNFVKDEWLSSLVLVNFIAIYFCVALLPELGFDALAMHLTIPAHVAEHHRWGFEVEKYVWAVMPMNGDWLYTFTYMLGGEAAARLLNFALLLVVTSLMASAVKAWASPKLVTLAIGVFLSLPLTYMESTSLFVENAWAVFTFAGILCVLLFAGHKENKYLFVASALLGIGIATKVVTIFLMFPLSIVVGYFTFRDLRASDWKKIYALCIVIFFAFGSIPYAIAYIKTGNPVFPFYNALFKSSYFDMASSFDQPTFKMGFNFLTLKEATFSSGKFVEGQTGSLGWVLFTILPPSILLILFSREDRYAVPLLFVSISFIALTFHWQSYLRYIYPAIPILVLIMMQGVDCANSISVRLGSAISLLTWFLIGLSALFLPAASGYYRELDFGAIFSTSARDKFLEEKAPVRRAIAYINAVDGDQARVGVFANPLIAGIRGTPYIANWYNDKFVRAVYKVADETQMFNVLKVNAINRVILDENFNPANQFPLITPLLKAVTTLDKQYTNISVRSVRMDLVMAEELLVNPDFRDLAGWEFTDAHQYQAETHSILASVSRAATQTVEVTSGADYQLEAQVRCITPGSMFRLQVNWLNSKRGLVGVDITPFLCSNHFERHTKIVRAPSDASMGIIYATGHSGDDQVEYKSLSFKR